MTVRIAISPGGSGRVLEPGERPSRGDVVVHESGPLGPVEADLIIEPGEAV